MVWIAEYAYVRTYVYTCINFLFTVGISQVNGIELQCSLVTLINQCTVTWRWNNLQETVTNFSIASNVGRFSAPSQSTSHTFPVLSLPDGAQNGEVTVKVVAVNELGQGPPSEVVRTNITGKLQSCIVHVYVHV